MACVPTARLLVLKLAVLLPPDVLNVPWPRVVLPSKKVTLPVGVRVPLPARAAG